jgi:thiol-disulfide isomerase/thioredoxin
MELSHFLKFFGAIIAVVVVLNWLGLSPESSGPVLMVQSPSPFVFTFYYLTSCGHCRNAKPEWDRFRSSYSGPVQIQEVDAEANQEEVRSLGINKFPTFL